MSEQHNDLVTQLVGAGVFTAIGAAIGRLFNWWSGKSDKDQANRDKERDEFKTYLLTRMEEFDKTSEANQVELIRLNRALSAAEATIKALSNTQGRIVEATMSREWIAKGAEKAVKEQEENNP